jgi:hypothetical protein
MAEALGYYVDCMAYMSVSVGADGELARQALFAAVDGIAAKDRTGRLGVAMEAPTIPKMMSAIFNGKEQT